MGASTSTPPSIQSKEESATELYNVEVNSHQWPIVYSKDYNIKFGGLEKMHPFDSGKWGKIIDFLKEAKMITDENLIIPKEATEADLLQVHTQEYINSLKSSLNVAMITEVAPVAIVPNSIVQRILLNRFRLQTGGTILAAKLAIENGWAINVGGGFHHCSATSGGGFCVYADITLAIKLLFKNYPNIKKAMIIDLDAHQGNGHERDFMEDDDVYILDVYNSSIYPGDYRAKAGITRSVELASYIGDEAYLTEVKANLEEALEQFSPHIILYNAGTDILIGDPLGHLNITAKGIIRRDEIVFQAARQRNIPILMVTSGGYLRSTARIIADSILNLNNKKLLTFKSKQDDAITNETDTDSQSRL